ncbi:MAG: helix-turn-helix transcriptional regulator [Clostridiaceae bacterium]|nr:helix-turn-helix transcriptional regulator [Clostridiaceae bacterium]
MSKHFRASLGQELKNPQFREEWERLEPEFQIIKVLLEGRNEKKITQKELSLKTGIAQGDISKLEQGRANPSIRTLQRLAKGLGKELRISFVDPKP